jgi:hypothetical protein
VLSILASCWQLVLGFGLGGLFGLIGGAFLARKDLRAYASELARYRTTFGFIGQAAPEPASVDPAPTQLEGR